MCSGRKLFRALTLKPERGDLSRVCFLFHYTLFLKRRHIFVRKERSLLEVLISCDSVYTYILIYALPNYAIGGYPNAIQKMKILVVSRSNWSVAVAQMQNMLS